jgi:hypothetical protein
VTDRYEASMEPDESDHKPVLCLLNVDLSVIDEADRRHELGRILNADAKVRKRLALYQSIPETAINTDRLLLEGSRPSIVRLSNHDRLNRVIYVIYCEGLSANLPCPCGKHTTDRNSAEDQYSRGRHGFPTWLKVSPAAGVLEPSGSASLSVAVERTAEDRTQNKLDNVVILVVNVKGVFSPKYKQHKICATRVQPGPSVFEERDVRRRSMDHTSRRPSSAGSDSQGPLSRLGSGSSFNRSSPDFL